MTTISARVIVNPRRRRKCADCKNEILGPQLKLYGSAHRGEKPYNLYLHLCCGDPSCERSMVAVESYEARNLLHIVELEPSVWLAPWAGDPGRTLVRQNAKQYFTRHGALIALGKARKFREFRNAVVTAV